MGDMLDNQERMAIKKATGVELNVATMVLEPAITVMKNICVGMDDHFLHIEELMRGGSVEMKKKNIVSMVTFIESFTLALTMQDEVEHKRFSALFKQVDKDGSGVVDYEEFMDLCKSTPALS